MNFSRSHQNRCYKKHYEENSCYFRYLCAYMYILATLITKKCCLIESRITYIIPIRRNCHHNRELSSHIPARRFVSLPSFHLKKNEYFSGGIESKKRVLLTQLFSSPAVFKYKLVESQGPKNSIKPVLKGF